MRWMSIIMVAMTCTIASHANDEIRVIGNRVNLRARPDLNAETVGQVNRGDLLRAKSMTDTWVEIVPPVDIDFWVHSDFIDQGEVASPRLNVRAGPSVNYSVVATLERGTRVTQRGQFSEWISIEPPTGASLWITRDLVEVIRPEPPPRPTPPPPAPKPPKPEPPPPRPAEPPPTPRTLPPPTPLPPVVDRPAPPPPRDLDLIPLEGQGELVSREGVLRPAGFVFGRPSRYRLTRTRGHSIETICYVRGNEAQLQSLLGHQLVIGGREYWVQGARYPVLVPDQITLKPPSP